MKPKVLWVEDSARFELSNLTGPVYFSGKYDFQQAENVTTAINFLKTKEFDVLIVDIRLPPGVDKYWLDLYQNIRTDGGGEKLGLKFLYWLFSRDGEYPGTPPSWIHPSSVGIFTVETYSEISVQLTDLGVTVFKQKIAGLPDTTLLEMIEDIIANKSRNKKAN
ncbi:MAG: hypothetical protein M1282_18290 [Chloroflexi bacterium]|nr:hypothetical protein [Chloroflexota bacterium]